MVYELLAFERTLEVPPPIDIVLTGDTPIIELCLITARLAAIFAGEILFVGGFEIP